MQTTDNIVIAFVPGTSASELNTPVDAAEMPNTRVWPEALEIRHVGAYSRHHEDNYCSAIVNETPLTVGDLVDQFTIGLDFKCYHSLIHYMQTKMGFTSAISKTCSPLYSKTKYLDEPLARVFYHCPYDWRQTNQVSAGMLNTALNELDSVYASKGQTYKLYIVGHSMGGLVSRCLLEDPALQRGNWFQNTQALITLATPHYGAPLALRAILGQKIAGFLEAGAYVDFIKAVVDKPEFPSTYELLPPPGKTFIQDSSGNSLDIYTDDTSAPFVQALDQLGFCAESLGKVKDFFSTLTVTSPENTPVPYYCFVGTGHETFANNDGTHQLAFTYQAGSDDPFKASPKVLEGDRVVPQDSARFIFQLTDPQCQTFPYTHGQMGGSDMDGHPGAIEAMLKLIGLPVPQAAPTAQPQTETSST